MIQHYSEITEDEDGWPIARCSCGGIAVPVPDMETACDVLMGHAFDAGVRAQHVGGVTDGSPS